MKNISTNNLDRDEQDIARLLQAAGPRAELPEELGRRWEQQFRDELKPVLQQRRRRRHVTLGLCASVAALGLAALLNWQTPDAPSLIMNVARVSGDSQLLTGDDTSHALRAGQRLSLDAVVITGAGGFAAINYGGYDLRLNNNSRVQLKADGIALESGEIYVSNEETGAREKRIKVMTRFGTIEDVGTQFSVSVAADRVVSTVRRGAIVLSTPTDQYRAEARPDAARQIISDGAQLNQIVDTASSGADWAWIYQSAPRFQLEGQSVFDFLRWSSRESGMRLEYRSKSAEIYARTTILHGDINGLDPDRAVEPVLSTTHLRVARDRAGTLQVSLPARE